MNASRSPNRATSDGGPRKPQLLGDLFLGQIPMMVEPSRFDQYVGFIQKHGSGGVTDFLGSALLALGGRLFLHFG